MDERASETLAGGIARSSGLFSMPTVAIPARSGI
jgi:hypothetical protein